MSWIGGGTARAMARRKRFGRREPGLEARAAQTISDGFQHVAELSLRHIEFLSQLGLGLASLAGKSVPFDRKGLCKGFGQGRLHHALREHCHNLMFEGLASVRPTMLATPARDIVAGVAAPGIRRKGASTGAIHDFAGEEVAGRAFLPKAGRTGLNVLGRRSLGQALLDGIPKLLLDQTKLRLLTGDTLINGVQPIVMPASAGR